MVNFSYDIIMRAVASVVMGLAVNSRIYVTPTACVTVIESPLICPIKVTASKLQEMADELAEAIGGRVSVGVNKRHISFVATSKDVMRNFWAEMLREIREESELEKLPPPMSFSLA